MRLMAQVEMAGWSKAEVAAAALYVVQQRIHELRDSGLEVPLLEPWFPVPE